MKETMEFLVRHGYTVLFVWVLGEQIGLPIPAVPVLMAAGALAGEGRLSWVTAMALALIASLVADTLWFEFGKRRGASVLNLLCRISLEPDSCVRRTEGTYDKYGPRTLLVAKFIPGLATAAPPVMGMFGLSRRRFWLFDAAGAAVWAGAFLGIGYLFSSQIELAATYASRFGGWLVLLVAGALAFFIALKYRERRLFMRTLVESRIAAEELKSKLDAGEPVFIVDLRHALDALPDPRTLPGAVRMTPEELMERNVEIPRDREVILYCT
jgi:membrane protein DedA with SNARE-associated domain